MKSLWKRYLKIDWTTVTLIIHIAWVGSFLILAGSISMCVNQEKRDRRFVATFSDEALLGIERNLEGQKDNGQWEKNRLDAVRDEIRVRKINDK